MKATDLRNATNTVSRRRPARAPRGQGLTETAIGLLVFVTILLAGIQFAEIGFLSLKVTEAGNFAVWDATKRRAHQLGNPGFNAIPQITDNTSPASASGRAQARYADFDAFRTSGASITQVLVTGSNLSVTCEPAGSLFFLVDDQGPPNDRFRPATMLAPVVNLQGGGMRCRASASLTSRMPENFAQKSANGGFFEQAHNTMTNAMTVCALGRASGGVCGSHFPILLGDWGLIGPGEAGEVPHNSFGGNPVYASTIQAVWGVSGAGTGSEAEAMAAAIGGSSPYSMGTFNMSALNQGGAQSRPGHGGIPTSFETHGADPAHPQPVANCFLGLPGC